MESSYPPGPSQPPLVQTLRWLLRPIAFLEDNRRRFGDAFSVTFLGFQTPMVMLSDPADIRALYTERAHGLPPGRTFALRPILGARSVLLLEGAEHLARRKVMLPPFHGDRMRAYEPIVRDAAEREIATWPADAPFPVHPRMQAVTLEVIMRAVFGVQDRPELADALRGLLHRTASPGRAVRDARRPPARHHGPDRADRARGRRARRRCCWAIIAEHGEDGDDILSPAQGRPLRGRRADERPRDPRPAPHPAARRPRDDRHRAGLDLRPAAAPPARPRAARRGGRRGRRRLRARDRRPRRCACARSSRSPAAA